MADYIRDPDAIRRASLAAVRAEVDLDAVPADMEALALRLVHACALPAIIGDLSFSPGAGALGRAALGAGAAILADCQMVAAGITRSRLPADNEVICTLNHPAVADMASASGGTRSAAAVELCGEHLEGSVVAIGNAPTALFRLLELIAGGAPAPALIAGFPVGFIGAAEAKDALIGGTIPFITLKGRMGGSALAAAAVNALAGDGL
jgi:precorrin-8X/cobalt-precorrin-8 methylmutase